jgi:hypothetical protein
MPFRSGFLVERILLATAVRCRKEANLSGSIGPYRFTMLPTRMSS